MVTILKRLSLGITLIVLSAGVLVFSDWNRRVFTTQQIPRLAIIQHASQAVLDEGVKGMIQGLEEMGFADNKTITIQRYNAENDMPTANAIAAEVVNGQFDLLLTASTLTLQTVAQANKQRKVPHVFALVSDPFGAGVGISRDDPLDHPANLTGYGTMQPVEKAFRIAKQLWPDLSSVGVAWNPGESNSEANVLIARQVSQKLGITLVEAPIENSSGVFEAAASLVGKGVQALWVGGDLTVIVAFDAVQRAANNGKIPVFTNIPPLTKRGALFDLGANYHEVGRRAGLLAGQVVKGANPGSIPVINLAPEKLVLNPLALKGLREPWRMPDDLLAQADTIIKPGGAEQSKSSLHLTPPPGRTFTIGVVYFGPDPVVESGLQGFRDGLHALGFIEGKNLTIQSNHAQGDMVNIPTIIQSYMNKDFDLIVPLTTPCLTAASGMVKDQPVVFSVVYDPIAAGAGKSRTDHLPNVTGVGSFPPVEDTVKLIRQLVPRVRTVGTLYNSSEANSRKVVGVARKIFEQAGITLEEVTISNSSEVFQAAQAVATRDIEALWITGDNTAFQAFEGIVKVSEDFSLPLIINDPEFTKRGALACQGLGFYQPAYESATLAARILLGENPKDIPFGEVKDQKLCLNFQVAKQRGMNFSRTLIEQADLFYHFNAYFERPAEIAFVGKIAGESSMVVEGLTRSFSEIGMEQGQDFVIHVLDEKQLKIPNGQTREHSPDIFVTTTNELADKLHHVLSPIPIIGLTESTSGKTGDTDSLKTVSVGKAKEIVLTLALTPPGLPQQ
ncbi:MAG: ABC transporter substrate-binding protein [Nitrospirales bacterium]